MCARSCEEYGCWGGAVMEGMCSGEESNIALRAAYNK